MASPPPVYSTTVTSDVWLVWKSSSSNPQIILGSRPRGYAYAVQIGQPGMTVQDVLNQVFSAEAGAPSGFNVTGSISNPWNTPLNVKTSGGVIGALDTTGNTLYSGIADAINSVTDFLKLISWLFFPRNVLRAVEFLVGIALMVFGLHAALQSRGERLAGFTSAENALSRSALGRVADELGAAARRRGSSGSSQESPRQPRKVRQAPHKRKETERRERHRRGERALSVREQRERRLSQQQARRTGGSKAQY